jgi:hypothetical protein
VNEAAEIIKSGAFDKLADLMHKFLGPTVEEFGLLLGDKARVYRVRNLCKVAEKTKRILEEASLPSNPVPPRVLLPIIEASSIEDNEDLQQLWAGLLASASERSDSLSPSFVETLKQLTPNEAKVLACSFDFISIYASAGMGTVQNLYSHLNHLFPQIEETDFNLMIESFERLGLFRRQFDLVPPNPSLELYRQLFSDPPTNYNYVGKSARQEDLPELAYSLEFTLYGAQFMEACRGPRNGEVFIPEPDTY